MGTQDERNNADPQNEFLSGFRIKDRAGSHKEESQQSSVSQAVNSDVNKTAIESQNNNESNPYRLTQKMDKNINVEKIAENSFEKKAGSELFRKMRSKLINKDSDPVDTRQKIMVALIPILFVVMVFMFRQVLRKPTQDAQAVESKVESAPISKKSSGSDIEWKIPDPLPVKINNPKNVQQNTNGSNDQTDTANNTEEGMYIKSILYTKDKPSVIIGNKIVYLNQEINGAVVVEIQKDYVVFEKDNRRWTQKLAEELPDEKIEEN